MKFNLPNIIFEATQECNLSCLYCYNPWYRDNREIKKSSYRESKKTLKRLLETVDFMHITFTGGEPLLAEGLMELVLMCRLKGKNVNIISNGTTASRDNYILLNNLGVSLFEFPLLADSAEFHDALARKSGSYEKVVDSIKFLKKAGAKICTVLVITKMNIERLGNTLALAASLGVDYFMLARFNIGGRGIHHLDKLPVKASQLQAAFDFANNFAITSSMHLSANVCVPECVLDPAKFPRIRISGCGVDVSRRPVTVDFSGDVRICNHSPVVIGNIHNKSLEEIFQGDYMKSWETTCPEFCTDCGKWEKCGGGCRAASEQLGYPLDHADPIIEMMGITR